MGRLWHGICYIKINSTWKCRWRRPDLPVNAGINVMKLITAVIKPFKLDDVRQAIADIGITGRDGYRSARVWQSARTYRELSGRLTTR